MFIILMNSILSLTDLCKRANNHLLCH